MAREIVGKPSAALSESIEVTKSEEDFNYGLRKIPKKARDKFNQLKQEGLITGSMNAYIIGAFLQRLRKDEKEG